MGRKKSKFQWVADDVPEDGDDFVPYVSRRPGHKKQKANYDELAEELSQLSAAALGRLEESLPPGLGDAVVAFQKLPGTPARRRQLLRVKAILRDYEADVEEIRAAIADRGVDPALRWSERWRDKLIAEPATLTELLEELPGADRQHFRALTREAAKGSKKAPRKLFEALVAAYPLRDQA